MFVQAQDSEAGGIQPSHVTTSIKDVFDLRQAYLEFRPARKAGSGSESGGRNSVTDRAPDRRERLDERAARIRRSSPHARPREGHVDVFTSAVVVNHPESFDTHPGGFTFHGIYGSLSDVVPKATIEPYVLWKALPVVTSEEGKIGDENLWTYGFRWLGKLPRNFDYTAEAARRGASIRGTKFKPGAVMESPGIRSSGCPSNRASRRNMTTPRGTIEERRSCRNIRPAVSEQPRRFRSRRSLRLAQHPSGEGRGRSQTNQPAERKLRFSRPLPGQYSRLALWFDRKRLSENSGHRRAPR